MVNKTLGIDLKFNADVTSAISNLRNLQSSLTQISTMPVQIGKGTLTNDMKMAVNSAKELKFHFTNAFNVKTGNLDLKKLNSSLQTSGQSLSQLSTKLLGAGMAGEQAFINIQRAITTANVQINSTSTLMSRFMATLKNTARWQLSSSLLHGFIGGLQSALTYAKDLDKSLNNIRIVTSYGVEEMSKFALEANKAAQALHTTTTQYTNASLIYFQQGLDMKEVKERVETTIKLANVSRQSVEETANQLTAVWSNFADGTKELEYYADVLTALGAATASSTDEIAGGLEKFAAVGKTIGLSYEYAAAALATITANTRQSEEVVGTALKTIFARIQGLKLGESLEDGTDLNKYSEALEKVGISIYNTNGELKNMDTILDETAAKWKTLSKDQQAALAQTVAGIRQYTQFIALMNNWDDGTSDSMVSNINTAVNATGELQEQADKYADSWEAASDKLKTSMESIWNNLIPTEGLKSFISGMSEIVEIISSAIRGFGGIQSILLLITNIVLTKMGPSITQGINQGIVKFQEFGQRVMGIIPNTITAFKNLGASFKKDVGVSADSTIGKFQNMRSTLTQIAAETGKVKGQLDIYNNGLQTSNNMLHESQLSIQDALSGTHNLTDTFKSYLGDMAQVNNLQALITKNSHLFTAATKEQLQGMQQQLLTLAEKKAQEADQLELLKQQRDIMIEATNDRMATITNEPAYNGASMSLGPMNEQLYNTKRTWGEILVQASGTNAIITNTGDGLLLCANNATEVESAVMGVRKTSSAVRQITAEINQKYSNSNTTIEEQVKGIRRLVIQKVKDKEITSSIGVSMLKQLGCFRDQAASAETVSKGIQTINNHTSSVLKSMGDSDEAINNFNNNAERTVGTTERLNLNAEQYKQALEDTVRVMGQGLQASMSIGAALQGIASGASKVAMGINQVSNFFSQLYDENADFTSLLVSGTMAATMSISALMTVLKGATTVMTTYNMAKELGIFLTKKQTGATAAEWIINKLSLDEKQAEAVTQEFINLKNQKDIAIKMKQILMQNGYNLSLLTTLKILGLLAVAITAAIAVYNIFFDKESEAEAAVNRANKALEEQKRVLEETKKEHEELVQNLDKYQEAYEKVQNLTKGTKEWTKATEELNKQVIDLITKYPELGDKVVNNNGVLSFSDGGEAAIKASENRVKEAERRTMSAQRVANEAKIVYSIEKMVGSNENAQQMLQQLIQQYSIQGEQALALPETNQALDALSAILGTNEQEIINLIRSTNSLNETNQLLLKQEAKGIFEDNEEYSKAFIGYQDVIDTKAAEILDQESYYAAMFYETAEDNLFDGNNNYTDYLKAMYGDDYVNYRVVDQTGDATVQHKNDQGQWETVGEADSLSDDEAAMTTARYYAREYLKRQVEQNINPSEIIAELEKEEKTLVDEGYSKDTARQIVTTKNLGGQGSIDFTTFTKEELNQFGTTYASDNNQISNLKDYGNALKAQALLGEITVEQANEKYAQAEADMNMRQQYNNYTEQGGLLGAINASYKQMRDDAVAEYHDSIWYGINKEILNQYNNPIDRAFGHYDEWQQSMVQIDSAKREAATKEIDLWFADLTDEEQRLAATSMRFNELTTSVEDLDKALQEVKNEQAYASLDTAAEQYELDAEVLEAQAKQIQASLEESSEEMDNAAEVAVDMAIANQRLNKGVKKLTDDWKDWKKALKGTDKEGQDYAEAMAGVSKVMADILNLSGEAAKIPANFFEDQINIDLLDQIADGSEEAVKTLHQNLVKAQITAETFQPQNYSQEAFELFPDLPKTANEFEVLKTKAINALDAIGAVAKNTKVGEALSFDDTQAIEDLNAFARAANWTAEEMNSALASVEAKATLTYVDGDPVTKQIPQIEITRKRQNTNDPDEEKWVETSKVVGHESYTEPTMIPQISYGDEAKTKPLVTKLGSFGKIQPSSTTKTTKSSSGGGSKNKYEPKKNKRFIEEKNYLHDYEQELNKIERELEKINIAKEKAWGKDKINAIKEETKALEKENQRIAEALKAPEDGKTIGGSVWQQRNDWQYEVSSQASQLGVTAKYDEDGLLSNREELFQASYQKMLDKQAYYDDLIKQEIAKGDKANEEDIKEWKKLRDEATERHENFMGDLDSSDEAGNKYLEEEAKKRQNELKILQNNYTAFADMLELYQEASETEAEIIDTQIGMLENRLFATAETSALFTQGFANLSESLEYHKQQMVELQRLKAEEKITDEDFREGMKKGYEDQIEIWEKMKSKLQEVGEYYQQLIDKASEFIEIHIDTFDQFSNLLQHYKDVNILKNGEQDYKTLNKINNAQKQILKDQISTSETTISGLKSQRDQLKQDLENTSIIDDEEKYNKIANDLQAVEDMIVGEEEKIMSALNELGEIAMDTLTNTLGQAKKEFQKAVFGDSTYTIEDMINKISRMNQVQEEFLTDTNKLYETNKLIRQAQLDMDKTSNQRAKQQYNDYIKSIEQLQKKGKLSAFELELAQADYEILQKKIALEEARDAKNQVRLTRDSEGNYGYVYTANQDNIAQAEQEFADAQNKRYNIALEGAQKYQDQFYQSMDEMYAALDELEQRRAEGLISEEQYNEEYADITETYLDLMGQSYDLYYMATDAMMEESASKRLDYALQGVVDMDIVEKAVDKYTTTSEKAFEEFDEAIEEVAQTSEKNFQKMEDGIKDITTESKKLKDYLNTTLIPAITTSLGNALKVSGRHWSDYAKEVEKAVKQLKKAKEYNAQITYSVTGNTADLAQAIAAMIESEASSEEINSYIDQNYDKSQGLYDVDYSQLANEAEDPILKKAYQMLHTYKANTVTDWMQEMQNALLKGDNIEDIQWMIAARDIKLGEQSKPATSQDDITNWIMSQDWLSLAQKALLDNAGFNSKKVQGYIDTRDWKLEQLKQPATTEEELKDWMKKNNIAFDTGGYTGSWGPEGRMAMLHEKELVLNKQDTENFLIATGMLREISQMLDNNALVASLGAINLHAMTLNSPADQVLQQEVTIHADFPNVVDHNEIEIAIDNLINAASQYAYRT